VDVFFVLIELPIREVLPALTRLPELAAPSRPPVTVRDFSAIETDGVLLPIEVAIREVLPALTRLPELAAPSRPRAAVTDFATVEVEVLSVPIDLPIREPILLLRLVIVLRPVPP
jgi:hypothetical protein